MVLVNHRMRQHSISFDNVLSELERALSGICVGNFKHRFTGGEDSKVPLVTDTGLTMGPMLGQLDVMRQNASSSVSFSS